MKEGIEKADVKHHQKAEEKWAAKAASLCPRPTSFASCVVETATHTLAYTATQDVAVPLRINKSGQALSLKTTPANKQSGIMLILAVGNVPPVALNDSPADT